MLEPLLPAVSQLGRPLKWTRRQLIDGIRWRARTGAPWRDVPARYGRWQSVYGQSRRWQRDVTWAADGSRLQQLADSAGLTSWEWSGDSQIARDLQYTRVH